MHAKVGCYAAAQSNWGCNDKLPGNMFVTDIFNAIMYSSNVLINLFHTGGWYRLPGYGHNSLQLVFSDVDTRFIYKNQDIRILTITNLLHTFLVKFRQAKGFAP